MIPQTSTAQRIIGLFAQYGVTTAMLVQMQHLQELAMAINLQGRHLIHIDLFGYPSGMQQLTLAGCLREAGWAQNQKALPSRCIEIPEGGDDSAMRDVQSQLSSAAADLMALLEEAA